jgi:pimeloyl-ACP methyl ester carboxylesterase
MLSLMVVLALATPAFADIHDKVDHHFADNNGVKLHYVSAGEGPVVLFVHGFPDYWYTWRHQMEGLMDNYKVVAMDMRAYNKSDQPKGVENYTMDLLMADFGAVIDDLGVENVTLVAHDWGAGIAWRYAIYNQDKVNKLVICNLTHPTGYATVRANATPEQKANTNYITVFQDPKAHERFTAKGVTMMVAGKESKEVQARYEAAFEKSSFDGMLNYYRSAFGALEAGVQEIPALDVPVLQFHGLKDTAVDKDGLRDTWNWITQDYTLVSIPSVGHWVQGEAADMVTTTMKWWLKARP